MRGQWPPPATDDRRGDRIDRPGQGRDRARTRRSVGDSETRHQIERWEYEFGFILLTFYFISFIIFYLIGLN